MNIDPVVQAALIAGTISIIGAFLSHRSSREDMRIAREEVRVANEAVQVAREDVHAAREAAQLAKEAALHEVRQTQYKDVLAKRIELYPKLWHIHIFYETNWSYENKPKTREWAEEYVAKLNEFNLEGGLFFSQALYGKFHDLRTALYKVIRETEQESIVNETSALRIREIVYGVNGHPGLSTYEKDDLGSYRSTTLQSRD